MMKLNKNTVIPVLILAILTLLPSFTVAGGPYHACCGGSGWGKKLKIRYNRPDKTICSYECQPGNCPLHQAACKSATNGFWAGDKDGCNSRSGNGAWYKEEGKSVTVFMKCDENTKKWELDNKTVGNVS